MTNMTNTARRATTNTPIWLRALNWLADRDAAYRSAHKLRNQTDERLQDMGITHEEANATVYQRGSRQADANATPVTLTAFRIS